MYAKQLQAATEKLQSLNAIPKPTKTDVENIARAQMELLNLQPSVKR